MTVDNILTFLRESVTSKTYDIVPTQKNRASRRKHGLTIFDLEDFFLTITPIDLYSGPIKDRDFPKDEVFVFKKEILKGIVFYIKIKVGTYKSPTGIKILSCHEDEV